MKRIILATLSIVMFSMIAAGKSPRSAGQLAVISYNIRFGPAQDGENSWEKRKQATISMLKDQKPDIFGIQEAFSFQIGYILENMKGYGCVGESRLGSGNDAEHPSVFYDRRRIELIRWGNFWLSGTPDLPSRGWDAAFERNATWTLVRDKKSDRKFFFVNTHLDHVGKTARKEGLEMILSRIEEMNPEELPVVLAGDFNMREDDPAMDALDGKMSDARRAAESTDDLHTYNGWGDSRNAIDFIFFSGFKGCTEYRTIQDSYDGIPYISDHYPIKATLVL